MRWQALALAGLAAALLAPGPGERERGAPELGAVDWSRDFDAAARAAWESGRPLFALFQEVPGCATCVGFGETVLSHPLLVESIESDFVPVAILNNVPGPDAELLSRFGEPAWNDPVVRLLDAQGRDLIPRADRIWKPHDVAVRMARALVAAGRAVPEHLRLVAYEEAPREIRRVAFGMHCFWSGEACIGAIPGVQGSRAGWHAGEEVVEVRYDPAERTTASLLRETRRRGCAESVLVASEREAREAEAVFPGSAVRRLREPIRPAPASDQKRHLRASPLGRLALTPLQALRANAALAGGGDPLRWLSPRQRAQVAGAPAGG